MTWMASQATPSFSCTAMSPRALPAAPPVPRPAHAARGTREVREQRQVLVCQLLREHEEDGAGHHRRLLPAALGHALLRGLARLPAAGPRRAPAPRRQVAPDPDHHRAPVRGPLVRAHGGAGERGRGLAGHPRHPDRRGAPPRALRPLRALARPQRLGRTAPPPCRPRRSPGSPAPTSSPPAAPAPPGRAGPAPWRPPPLPGFARRDFLATGAKLGAALIAAPY